MNYLSILAILSCVAAVKVKIPSDVKVVKAPSGTKYAIIPQENGTTRAESLEKCLVLGGQLADIKLGADFEFLSKTVKGAAWINSFEEKNFNNACIALFEGGAIAVPIGNCLSTQGVLCKLNNE